MSIQGLSSRAIMGMYYLMLSQHTGASWLPLISNYFTSDQPSETYKWLGQSPMLRQWIGEKRAKGLRSDGLTIDNLEFEATLEFRARDMKRDKTGQVLVRIADLARRTNGHWAKLISQLINDGGGANSGLCYDGQYFFDDDHSEGNSGVQDNKLTCDISEMPASQHGTTTAPSAEEMMYAALAAIDAIMSYKDDQAEPMNSEASEFLIMTPTNLSSPARTLATKDTLGAGIPNQLMGNDEFKIRHVTNPRLTATDTFFVFRTDAPTKSFIRQEEEGVVMKAIAEGSEHAFKTGQHLYGVETSRNVGFGFWQYGASQQLI